MSVCARGADPRQLESYVSGGDAMHFLRHRLFLRDNLNLGVARRVGAALLALFCWTLAAATAMHVACVGAHDEAGDMCDMPDDACVLAKRAALALLLWRCCKNEARPCLRLG